MVKIQIDDGKSKKPATKVVREPVAKRPVAKKPVAKKSSVKKINVTKVSSKKPAKPLKTAKKAVKIETKKPVAKKVIVKERKIIVNPVSSAATHSTLQKSTTLSRRYVHRPEAVVQPAAPKATVAPAAPKIAVTPAAPKAAPKVTTEPKAAIKSERVLKSAARAAAKVDTPKEPALSSNADLKREFKNKHRGRRILLALLCSAATVGALVAFVHFNMPDISVRVAAMQTGIEATYPTFVPRNYSLASVSSDKDDVIVMNFNGPDGASFTLSEEKSTWDSTALLNNYVKKTYPSDYATLREQGITIYTRGENASWVNGGILYKIATTGKNLTKEQIRNIATSL